MGRQEYLLLKNVFGLLTLVYVAEYYMSVIISSSAEGSSSSISI